MASSVEISKEKMDAPHNAEAVVESPTKRIGQPRVLLVLDMATKDKNVQ